MKKSILKLGKALNKAEQKEVNGGLGFGTLPSECGCEVCSEEGGLVTQPTFPICVNVYTACDSTCPDGSQPYFIR